MSDADTVSIVVAATAVALALVAVPLVAARRRERDHTEATTTATAADPPAVEPPAAPAAVSIRLLRTGDDVTSVWRIAAAADVAAAVVDIFTYRPHDRDGAWCHELMEAPLRLGPGEHADLDGPPIGAAAGFDVTLGWTVGGVPASQFVRLRPTR